MKIEEVVEKYVQLRDEKAQIAERHKTELAPVNEQMEVIERWLLQEFDKVGVYNIKTAHGTAYKAITKNVKMTDPEAFKDFVFEKALAHISSIVGPDDESIIRQTLMDDIRWDLVDFRAGKKGIQEYSEENGIIPPGVTMDSFTTINIRRA